MIDRDNTPATATRRSKCLYTARDSSQRTAHCGDRRYAHRTIRRRRHRPAGSSENEFWAEYFPAPRPVGTTIVTGFTVPGMLIEIEVTAGVPS